MRQSRTRSSTKEAVNVDLQQSAPPHAFRLRNKTWDSVDAYVSTLLGAEQRVDVPQRAVGGTRSSAGIASFSLNERALDVARQSTTWRLIREATLHQLRQHADLKKALLDSPASGDPIRDDARRVLLDGGEWVPAQVEVNTTSQWTAIGMSFGIMAVTARRLTFREFDHLTEPDHDLQVHRGGVTPLTLRAEAWLKVVDGEIDVVIRKGSDGAASVRVWTEGRVLHALNRFHNHVRRQLVRTWKRPWREGVVSRHPVITLEVPDEAYNASGSAWPVREAEMAARRERKRRR